MSSSSDMSGLMGTKLNQIGLNGTLLSRANRESAIDFVTDGLATGRGLSTLTVVDSFTQECPAIEVDTDFPAVE
jgi:putative transposase